MSCVGEVAAAQQQLDARKKELARKGRRTLQEIDSGDGTTDSDGSKSSSSSDAGTSKPKQDAVWRYGASPQAQQLLRSRDSKLQEDNEALQIATDQRQQQLPPRHQQQQQQQQQHQQAVTTLPTVRGIASDGGKTRREPPRRLRDRGSSIEMDSCWGDAHNPAGDDGWGIGCDREDDSVYKWLCH